MISSSPQFLPDHVIKVNDKAKEYKVSNVPKFHCLNDPVACQVSLYGQYVRKDGDNSRENCFFLGVYGTTFDDAFTLQVFDVLEHEQGPGIFLCAYTNRARELLVCLLMNFKKLLTGNFDLVSADGKIFNLASDLAFRLLK